MANNTVKVLQDPEKKVSVKVMADAIVDISEGFKKVRSAGLTDRALLCLLNDSTGVNKTEIKKVIDGISALEKNYVNRKAT